MSPIKFSIVLLIMDCTQANSAIEKIKVSRGVRCPQEKQKALAVELKYLVKIMGPLRVDSLV